MYQVRNLLIVPYGIETELCIVKMANRVLLIVPYGIETYNLPREMYFRYPFNRTLWN